ncbi:DUF6644 family protein [Pontibacter sp. H259]|uniref:DUF6644 family protein n=1 Tax=Pontibacter sp. H259 TaxID=3133421 RepID=UPI0030BE3A64
MNDDVEGLWQAIENSQVATTIQQSVWAYPALEIVHFLGIVMLVGPAFLFDLRLLGIAGKLPVKALALYLLPWSRRALLLIVPSGLLLFSTNAVALAADPVFIVKLSIIVIAGLNAGIFHFFQFPDTPNWSKEHTPKTAKIIAIVSIVCWLTVITCGRLLAY